VGKVWQERKFKLKPNSSQRTKILKQAKAGSKDSTQET
jgi:hypothetical protein